MRVAARSIVTSFVVLAASVSLPRGARAADGPAVDAPAVSAPAADAPAAAVLAIRHESPAGRADVARVRAAVKAALARRGHAPVADEVVTRMSETPPRSCRAGCNGSLCLSGDCMRAIVGLLDARVVMGGRLQRPGDESWVLQLWLYDAQQKATQTAQIQCDDCALSGVVGRADALVATLIGRAEKTSTSAYVSVRSKPTGALVIIDGTKMGATDITLGLDPGRHTVTLEKQGFEASVHRVELEAGTTGTVEAFLAPAGKRADGEGGLFAARTLRWVLLGGAVVGLGVGIPLLAIDGSGACDSAHALGRCAERYDTMAPGVVFTAIGAAAAVGSAFAFYWAARTARAPRAAALIPWVGHHAGGLSATASF